MAASIKDIKEVQIPQEYELIKAEFVEEADSFVLTLRHRKSQALSGSRSTAAGNL